jgi:hypothetical protein
MICSKRIRFSTTVGARYRSQKPDFHDGPICLPAGRDWVCIGELEWRVEGDRFVHELKPLQHRSEQELEKRAERTKMHRAYRERLWEQYSLEQRHEAAATAAA